MAKTGTSWGPGQSGNSKGRPKKDRPLTQLLIEAGGEVLKDADDTPHDRRVAQLLWTAAASGVLRFPGARSAEEVKLGGREWLGLVRWLYTQIDGPPATRVKLSRDDESDDDQRLSPEQLRDEIHDAVRELGRLGVVGPLQLGAARASEPDPIECEGSEDPDLPEPA